MDQQATFAAEVIRSGAGALAGFAASELIEQRPGLTDRYGRRAFAAWKSELEGHLVDLAAALDAAEPQIFATQIAWARDAFEARGVAPDDLRAALTSLQRVLAEELPESARTVVEQAIAGGIQALDRPSEPARTTPAGTLASSYLLKTLEGDRRGAIRLVLDAIDAGKIDTIGAYMDVIIPAQCQVGELWHKGDVNVAEEHFTTMTSQSLMAVILQRATPAEPNGHTVVSAAVAGDAHDIGVRTLADLFELAGWRSIFLGADVPNVDLAQGVEAYEPDLVALGASLPTLLPSLERAIRTIRETEPGRNAKVLVGGGAFTQLPTGHSRVGADALAPDVRDAVRVGAGLVGLAPSDAG